MSIRLMTSVWERSPYRGGALLAHLALADWANDEGLCWPSQAELGMKARLEERQIRNVIKQMESDRLIERVERRGRLTVWRVFSNRQILPPSVEPSEPAIDDTATGNPQQVDRQSVTALRTRTKSNRQEPSIEPSCPLSQILAELIEANGSKRPTITRAWRNAERLLITRDKRDPAEAEHLVRWSQASEFWAPNILSMPKFRDKYDTLRLQAKRGNGTGFKPRRLTDHLRLSEMRGGGDDGSGSESVGSEAARRLPGA